MSIGRPHGLLLWCVILFLLPMYPPSWIPPCLILAQFGCIVRKLKFYKPPCNLTIVCYNKIEVMRGGGLAVTDGGRGPRSGEGGFNKPKACVLQPEVLTKGCHCEGAKATVAIQVNKKVVWRLRQTH